MKFLSYYFKLRPFRNLLVVHRSVQKGFTLVELLVVMAVIGTLTAGLVVVVNPAGMLSKARDAERKSDLTQLQRALEAYYDDYNEYPSSGAEYIIGGVSWGGNWSPYMTTLPQDPVSDQRYVYFSTGQTYRLYAHLETFNDPQGCNTDTDGNNTECSNASGLICGNDEAHVCTYGVSSPNTSP